jgi:hypothetical protein
LVGYSRIADGEIMSAIPDRVDALLTRDATAAALTEAGYPVKAKTLATKASRGGGPPFQKYGNRPLYIWGSALAWAQSRLGPVVTSTSELDRTHRHGMRPGIKAPATDRLPAPLTDSKTSQPSRPARPCALHARVHSQSWQGQPLRNGEEAPTSLAGDAEP